MERSPCIFSRPKRDDLDINVRRAVRGAKTKIYIEDIADGPTPLFGDKDPSCDLRTLKCTGMVEDVYGELYCFTNDEAVTAFVEREGMEFVTNAQMKKYRQRHKIKLVNMPG